MDRVMILPPKVTPNPWCQTKKRDAAAYLVKKGGHSPLNLGYAAEPGTGDGRHSPLDDLDTPVHGGFDERVRPMKVAPLSLVVRRHTEDFGV